MPASLVAVSVPRWVELVQDKAVRPVVTMAALHQVLQRASHLLHLRYALVEAGHVGLRDALDGVTSLAVRSVAVGASG